MHLAKTVLVGMGLASGLNYQTLRSALETSLINYLCERPAEDKGDVSLFMDSVEEEFDLVYVLFQ
jgi:hypothetical protein